MFYWICFNLFALCSTFFVRNYAVAERDSKSNKSKSLQVLIEDLKDRVENRVRLKDADLQSILTSLATQKPNTEEALEILKYCTFVADYERQNAMVNKVWNKMKIQSETFGIQHYNSILSFARHRGDVNLAEDIVNEIKKNEIEFNV